MADEEFERFAVRCWPELVRLARLLTGDPRLAVDLADQVLAVAGAHWSAVTEEGTPTARVRRDLLERSRSRGVRRRLADRSSAPVPPGADAPAAADPVQVAVGPGLDLLAATDEVDKHEPARRARRDAVRRVLVGLPVAEREAAAVTHALDLPPADAAVLLGASPEQVDDRVRRADGAVADAVATGPDPDAPTLAEDPATHARRVVGDLLASPPALPPDPLARIARAGRHGRARRRTVLAVAAAAVVAVVATVGVVGTLTRDRDTAASASAPVAWDDLSTWPTRGDLAGDDDYLAEVTLAHPRTHTLFAGTVGARVVLVLWDRDMGTVQAYRAPRRTPVADISDGTDLPWTAGAVPRALAVQAGDGDMVVLARDGVQRVEVSPTAVVTPEGTVDRDWVPAPLVDGLAVFSLGADSHPRLVAAREPGEDGTGESVPVEVLSLDVAPRGTWTCNSCGGDGPDAGFVALTQLDVASMFGLPTEQVATVLRWAGPVAPGVLDGGLDGIDGHLRVALSTLPDGTVLRSAQVAWDDHGAEATMRIEAATPVPARGAADAPFALRGGQLTEGLIFQVVAPGASSVTLLAQDTSHLSPSQQIVDDVTVLASERPVTPTKLLLSTPSGGRVWPLSVLGDDDPLVRTGG